MERRSFLKNKVQKKFFLKYKEPTDYLRTQDSQLVFLLCNNKINQLLSGCAGVRKTL